MLIQKPQKMFAPPRHHAAMKLSPCYPLLLLIILSSYLTEHGLHLVKASGVFELELIEFKRLDQQIQSYNQTSNNNNINDPISVLICLKEAFTSQLDGPCTFGNASLTFGDHQRRQNDSPHDKHRQQEPESTVDTASVDAGSNQRDQQVTMDSQSTQSPNSDTDRRNSESTQTLQQSSRIQLQQTQGSLLTNVVRILFTFRWTKSFTIIITAEQPNRQQQSTGSNRTTANIVSDLSPSSSSSSQAHSNKSSSSPASLNFFADRHILTENEVLPNLETNSNKPWTSRFSRSLKSLLVYRFRVYCSLNYFGDGCTIFCRARDDQFGHYNCSSTGQKVCLDGWYGPNCDKARCRPGCNQQHGFCDRPDTCQCRLGWTGPRCDECLTYPGCQKGYCLSPWQCICQRNWGGVLCDQDLNYCGTHEPCKNNGTCQNVAPGRYRCHCPEGFTGMDCETSLSSLLLGGSNSSNSSGGAGGDATLNGNGGPALAQLSAGCGLNPCLNGGACFGFHNQLVDPSLARALIATTTEPIVDETSGQPIMDDGRLYRCLCPAGWTGDYCQWPADSTSVISIIAPELFNDNSTGVESSTQATQNVTSGPYPVGEILDLLVTNETDLDSSNNNNNNNYSSTSIELITTLQLDGDTTNAHNSNSHHHHHQHHPQLNMKHLISGVVIASVVGVFLAALLLAWCCLIAIEKNRFSFIQMNIVRGQDGQADGTTTTRLRRFQEKIRDSLRCTSASRNRIKPETRLSIENVLRPPPSYEESKAAGKLSSLDVQKMTYASTVSMLNGASDTECSRQSSTVSSLSGDVDTRGSKEEYTEPIYNLVNRGAIEHKMFNAGCKVSQNNNHSSKPLENSIEIDQIDKTVSPQTVKQQQLVNCPRHGPLYISKNDHSNQNEPQLAQATSIEIEYRPIPKLPVSSNTLSTRATLHNTTTTNRYQQQQQQQQQQQHGYGDLLPNDLQYDNHYSLRGGINGDNDNDHDPVNIRHYDSQYHQRPYPGHLGHSQSTCPLPHRNVHDKALARR